MEYTADRECALLAFLFEKMKDRSRTTVKSYLTHRQVSVNGRMTTRHDTPLRAGDRVEITREHIGTGLHHPLMRIVFEDGHLIVIDKRNGLLSMATDREKEKTAYHILTEYVRRTDPAGRIFTVHRLDRETSGLMLFVRNERVKEAFKQDWKGMVTDRRYIAVVEGRMPRREGVIDAPLSENQNYKVYVDRSGAGRESVTRYRVLREGGQRSLVELKLDTGRKNQIRAHLEYIGCPILGDRKYGASADAERVYLHAFKLAFRHPATGRELSFSTRIPRQFEEAVSGEAKKTAPEQKITPQKF